jgi:hypothetical protein
MTISEGDFLEFSQDLMNCNAFDTEIGYRNVISRSYYATFSIGVKLRDLLGLPSYANMGAHEALRAAFKCHQSRQVKLLATRLSVSHTDRIVADYYLNETITKEFSTQRLTYNKQLFSDIEKIILSEIEEEKTVGV